MIFPLPLIKSKSIFTSSKLGDNTISLIWARRMLHGTQSKVWIMCILLSFVSFLKGKIRSKPNLVYSCFFSANSLKALLTWTSKFFSFFSDTDFLFLNQLLPDTFNIDQYYLTYVATYTWDLCFLRRNSQPLIYLEKFYAWTMHGPAN